MNVGERVGFRRWIAARPVWRHRRMALAHRPPPAHPVEDVRSPRPALFMSSLRPLVPLLLAAGILLGGNGLQGTLIAVRGQQEGFSPTVIGIMGAAYFTGFLVAA